MALDSRTVIDRFHLTVPNLSLQNLDAPRINEQLIAIDAQIAALTLTRQEIAGWLNK